MKQILPHAVRDAGWLLHMAADERCPYAYEGDIVEVGAPVAIAGTGAQGGIEDNTDDEWHRVLDIDVLGPVRVTRVARALCSAGKGRLSGFARRCIRLGHRPDRGRWYGRAAAAAAASASGRGLMKVQCFATVVRPPVWPARPEVRRGVTSVAVAGPGRDVLLRLGQSPSTVRVLRELSDVRCVLDPAGNPVVSPDGLVFRTGRAPAARRYGIAS
ncbi:hypothetical protein AB0I69_15030 [Streptomyces sp. NPDC050508]|uniref:hypothetical protein n=1 Tax=Streptomyces sp. NPDC050508 TaxID=3155405 RepID=UPI00343D895D